MNPQPDLNTLASEGAISRSKIDRQAVEDDGSTDDGDCADADFPPESFWLSKDAEFDWFDRHAFLERKDSTKGNVNLNPHVKPSVYVQNSQRFSVSLKSRTSIIGLPKMQKASFVDSGRRTCKSANIRLFPKRSMSAGVSRVPFAEPVSPKVSCIGRVRSRGRRRSNSLRKSENPADKSKTGRQKPENSKAAGGKKSGLYSKVMGIFRLKKGAQKALRSRSRKVAEEDPPVTGLVRDSVSFNAASEPPGLASLQRFASGRRSGSWAAEDFSHLVLEPVDFDRRVCATLAQESRGKTLRSSSFN